MFDVANKLTSRRALRNAALVAVMLPAVLVAACAPAPVPPPPPPPPAAPAPMPMPPPAPVVRG